MAQRVDGEGRIERTRIFVLRRREKADWIEALP